MLAIHPLWHTFILPFLVFLFFLDTNDRSERFRMNLVLYFHLVIRFQLFHAMGQSFSCFYWFESNVKSLFYFCLFSFSFSHHILTNVKAHLFWEYFLKFGLNSFTFLAFLPSFSLLCKNTFSLYASQIPPLL